MFILAVKGFEEDGAFSIENDDGEDGLEAGHRSRP